MSHKGTVGREDITFEQGYEELKGIVARLGGEDISVHEMFEGFRRGKGLEQALRSYLTEREGELTEIEQGNNLPEFNIVAPSAPEQDEHRHTKTSLSADETLKARRNGKNDVAAEVTDSEIPF